MVEVDDLNQWEKLGISWSTEGWESVQYFKAPLSLRRLESLGLVETMIDHGRMGRHEIKIERVRLTPAGIEMKSRIEESGFDKFYTWKRRA